MGVYTSYSLLSTIKAKKSSHARRQASLLSEPFSTAAADACKVSYVYGITNVARTKPAFRERHDTSKLFTAWESQSMHTSAQAVTVMTLTCDNEQMVNWLHVTVQFPSKA